MLFLKQEKIENPIVSQLAKIPAGEFALTSKEDAKQFREAISRQMKDDFPERDFETEFIEIENTKLLKIKRIA